MQLKALAAGGGITVVCLFTISTAEGSETFKDSHPSSRRVVIMPVNMLPDDVALGLAMKLQLKLLNVLSRSERVTVASPAVDLAPNAGDYLGPLLVPKERVQELGASAEADYLLVSAVGHLSASRIELSVALVETSSGTRVWEAELSGDPGDCDDLVSRVVEALPSPWPLPMSPSGVAGLGPMPEEQPTTLVLAGGTASSSKAIAASAQRPRFQSRAQPPTTNPLAKVLFWGGLSALVAGASVGLAGNLAFTRPLNDGRLRDKADASGLARNAGSMAAAADVALIIGAASIGTSLVLKVLGIAERSEDPEVPKLSALPTPDGFVGVATWRVSQ